MLNRTLVAAALILAPIAAQAQDCITIDALLKTHGDALIERLPWPTASGLLLEMSKIAEPPEAIRPSAALVFRVPGNGVRVEFIDQKGCSAFGATFSQDFYRRLRDSVGVPA